MSHNPTPVLRRSLHLGPLVIPLWWLIALAFSPSLLLLDGGSAAYAGRALGYAVAGIALLGTAQSSKRPVPWVLLGLGALVVAAGDAVSIAANSAAAADGGIGLLSLVPAGGYLLAAAGLWKLRPGGSLPGVVDGLIVAIAGMAVGMNTTLIPMLSRSDESRIDQVALLLGAVAIVGRLASGARLISDIRPLPSEAWALVAWLALDFIGNAMWVTSLGGLRAALMGGIWMVAALSLAGLAISPTRSILERQVGAGRRAWMTRTRALAMAAAAVVPMAMYWASRDNRYGWILLAMGMVTFGLVVVRMILVTEDLAQHRNQLDHMAHHDLVSGLPNRAMFERRMRELRSGEDPPEVAVLYVDLDDFKDINDRFGHEVGDLVLAEVGLRLKASVRGNDMVARMGGDEFAVLVMGDRIEDAAGRVAVRIQHRLSPPFRPPNLDDHGEAVSLRASIGVAAPVTDLDRALRVADAAMYRAKRAGKGRIARAGVIDLTDGAANVLTEEDLAAGLKSGLASVAFQPVIDLGSGRVVGAEALLRWRTAAGDSVPTAHVVAIAERSGAIVEFGRWMTTESIRSAVEWKHSLGDRAPWLSVNLSRLEVAQDTLHQSVTNALAAGGLSPNRLVLEVTADILAELDPAGMARLRWLRSAGVRIAADDFGVGSQPLEKLGADVVDMVKLDRAYVTAGLEDDAVLADLLHRAGNLGAVTVAEGIETTEELGIVRQFGASLGQGYLFAAPLEHAPFLELLHLQSERPLDGIDPWLPGGPLAAMS